MYITTWITAVATVTTFSPLPLSRAPAPYPSDTTNSFATGDGNSQLQRWSSLIGIVTAIVGNILISFALNIQRYAHIRINREREYQERLKKPWKKSKNGYGTTSMNGNGAHHPSSHDNPMEGQEGETDPMIRSFTSQDSQATICSDPDHDAQKTTYLRSPYWWAGILLMTIGETGNFLAYGFAPASIVSPLGVVALISNCVIAPIMLKERFRWRDFWGVVISVGGAVTVVLSAKQKEKKLGPHEVIGAITTMEFEIYMGITVGLIALLAWLSPKYGNRTILIDLGLVGLFGGYTALSTKGVSSMLSSTLWKAFTTPITYALVAVLVGTAIMQVKYVNKALARFDSTQVIPVQFVMFTLSVIIGSATLYRDFEKTTRERMIKFVGGCLLTFFGVYLITSGRPQRRDEDEDFDEDEERIRLAEQRHHEHDVFYGDDNHKHARAQTLPQDIVESGDGAEDQSAEDQSRRSSRVSFAPLPSRPELPQRNSKTSQSPVVHLTPSADGIRDYFLDESTSLLSNPWKSSVDDLLATQRHPAVSSTTSTPALPSEARPPTPSIESAPRPATPRASSQDHFHTHPNDQNLNGPPQPDPQPPITPARHSMSRMMPGPFMSPLSSSLTAVVADELRRGVDSPSRYSSVRSSAKRARLSLRRHKSGSDHRASETGTENGDGSSAISRSLGSKSGEELMKRSRARSLSNALGDFLRGKRAKNDNGDVSGSGSMEGEGGQEGEAGPSGQTS